MENSDNAHDLIKEKLKTFLKSGFSILLLGERGTGKSDLVKQIDKTTLGIKENIVSASCASFEDDSKAEAELFGYEKGAFTGANYKTDGLLQAANHGILFLDEVHHLSKAVQAKLMRAFQTDKDNKMQIRRLGNTNEEKVECLLIFATNQSIEQLQQTLLLDFYDRIVQHVIEIPSVRQCSEKFRLKSWKTVWANLQFEGDPKVPFDKPFQNWLTTLPLYGNFRDLQKIAMYYNGYNSFGQETKDRMTEFKNAFEYTKVQYGKYSSPLSNAIYTYNFHFDKDLPQMKAEYFYALREWALKQFGGSRKKAAEFLGVSERTLGNWGKGLKS